MTARPRRKFFPLKDEYGSWRITAAGPFQDRAECQRACEQVQRAYEQGAGSRWWHRILDWLGGR